MSGAACAAPGCSRAAEYEVILYDFYPADGAVFFERDLTCAFICRLHAIENEARAQGVRQPRGVVEYPYTNRNHAQGLTIYRPVPEAPLTTQSSGRPDFLDGGEPTVH